jgi:hypothetical protein
MLWDECKLADLRIRQIRKIPRWCFGDVCGDFIDQLLAERLGSCRRRMLRSLRPSRWELRQYAPLDG